MGRIGTTGVGRGQDAFGVGVGNSGRTYRCAAGTSGVGFGNLGRMYRCTRGRSGGGIGNGGRILGDGADMKLRRGAGM
jgi:hypothetical protein